MSKRIKKMNIIIITIIMIKNNKHDGGEMINLFNNKYSKTINAFGLLYYFDCFDGIGNH